LDLIRVRCGSIAKFERDPIRVIVVSEHVLADPNALGNGSADPIYLRDKIASRCSGTTGRPGGSDRHIVRLGFGNLRCDRSQGDQIGSGPSRSATEFSENTVRVVSVVKREFAESDALRDRSADAIYLEDYIVSRFDGSP
jgi:hypothetical protein